MAAKKKAKKKQTKSRKPAGKKIKLVKKRKAVLAKKSAKKKVARKKAPPKPVVRKKAAPKTIAPKKPSRRATPDNVVSFSRESSRARSGGQSGDLQGLSNIERANSESVDELLEEGNTFEAEAVAGVESADNADEEEVHTHEVPEDDVPEEYLEKD